MGHSESKENNLDNDGVISQNLIVENEIKVTNNETKVLLKISVIIQASILLLIVLKTLIKYAKKEQQRDQLLSQRNANAANND